MDDQKLTMGICAGFIVWTWKESHSLELSGTKERQVCCMGEGVSSIEELEYLSQYT